MQKIFDKLTPANYLQFFQIARYSGLLISGIFLAKFGVPIHTIGQYEYILFLSGLVSFFWIGGIFQTLLSDYHSSSNKSKLLKNVCDTITSFGIFSATLIFLYFTFIEKQNNFDVFSRLIICSFILLNTITFYNENYFLIKEQYKKLAMYALGNFSIQLVAILTVLLFSPTLNNFALALFIVALWKFGILLKNLKDEKQSFGLRIDKELIKTSSPLIAGLLISGSADYIDSFLVIHFFGNKSYAIFKYGAKEFPLTLLLANSLSAAMVFQISRSETIEDGLKELKNQASRLMH